MPMACSLRRREFLKAGVCACVSCLGSGRVFASGTYPTSPALVSPGCRKSKVRVGKIYIGQPGALWPTPKMDLNAELRRYEREFDRLSDELSDVDFVGNTLVTSPEEVRGLEDKLAEVDGILVIHLSMGISSTLDEILSIGRPTVLFAAPYSGHEWTGFGSLRKQEKGAMLECLLTSDYDQLAVGIRPFRAIHHLREAKILNVTSRSPWADYVSAIKSTFGAEIKQIGREPVIAAYNAVPDAAAREEAERWIAGAEQVVEPSKEDIVASCKLALAFEKMLDEEEATVITADCYGTMYHQLPAYPCVGFTRLNNMGLGGICESDLQSAMTHIIFQGLSGRPGFISDPTMDGDRVILAHCLGTIRMDGPDEPPEPYKLRSIMERQEGVVPQVTMRTGQKVTQAKLIGVDRLLYFTGDIVETPDVDRGCRTKITVSVDGDPERLWQNWSDGLHRVTCYGDITEDLNRFCRFKGIEMVNEA